MLPWLGLLLRVPIGAASGQTVGERLPAFLPGGLDIHHINTGEGSSAFIVLPDRTTLQFSNKATNAPASAGSWLTPSDVPPRPGKMIVIVRILNEAVPVEFHALRSQAGTLPAG